MLDLLKSILRDQLRLPTWAVLGLFGVLAHALVNAVLRKQFTSAWGLLGPLASGILLESYEIWAHYRYTGLLAPSNDPLPDILARHAVDVAIMLAVPGLIVLAGWIGARSA